MELNSTIYPNSKDHLLASIEEVERIASEKPYNRFDLLKLGNVALLLGEKGIAERAEKLLLSIPDDLFWSGVVANFELPQPVPRRFKTLSTREECESTYPAFSLEGIASQYLTLSAGDVYFHLSLCFQGQTEKARFHAGSGRRLEEVGNTLAIMGNFDAALSVSHDPLLESFRQGDIRYIITIEHIRRGHFTEAVNVLSMDGILTITPGFRVDIALALENRMPWSIYPYPDW